MAVCHQIFDRLCIPFLSLSTSPVSKNSGDIFGRFFFLSRLQLFVKNKYVAAKWLFWGYDSQSSMKTTESWTMAFVFFLWKPFVFGTTDSAKYGEPVNKCRPITHMIHILEDWNHKMEGQPTKKDVKWVLWVYIC